MIFTRTQSELVGRTKRVNLLRSLVEVQEAQKEVAKRCHRQFCDSGFDHAWAQEWHEANDDLERTRKKIERVRSWGSWAERVQDAPGERQR